MDIIHLAVYTFVIPGMTRNPGIWCGQTGFPRSR